MATLIQSYEQQYSVLTADLTAKIGRLKSNNEGKYKQLILDILLLMVKTHRKLLVISQKIVINCPEKF